jgi:hypothetical protein
MEKEFVPYELALRMKALGFNENCYRVGNPNGAICWRFMDVAGVEGVGIDDLLEVEFDDRWVEIPTYSQAFRWFREKHYLISSIYQLSVNVKSGLSSFEYMIDKLNNLGLSQFIEDFPYNTYEEAELACLENLIEIVEK